jgi:hypothetical protein
MNARFLNQPRSGGVSPGPAIDDILGSQDSLPASRACCCPARPVVQVIMPPTAGRPHSVDLLLCGHHYRVSCQALAVAGATVSELPEIAGNKPTALLPELPDSRVPVS